MKASFVKPMLPLAATPFARVAGELWIIAIGEYMANIANLTPSCPFFLITQTRPILRHLPYRLWECVPRASGVAQSPK
jgi:hypothetical protein